MFSELRDLNFASVGKRLNKAARRLDEDYKVCTRLTFKYPIETEPWFRHVIKQRCLSCVILLGN